MLEAGDVITAEEAERRVLVLENPGVPGKSRITNSLFAGIQLIMPGEIADAHQHVSSAIRFVLEGEGAYTAVEGEKSQMEHGDFIITAELGAARPRQSRQGAGDVARRARHADRQSLRDVVRRITSTRRCRTPITRTATRSSATPRACCRTARRCIANRSPVINYPYAKMRPILERLKKTGDIDKRHGARVRYANPINGGPVLPTMGANLALLPKGFKGEPYRSTDGTIFCVRRRQGHDRSSTARTIEWGVNDVFVVPPWKRYQHNAGGRVGAVLDLRSSGAGSARHLARRQLKPSQIVIDGAATDLAAPFVFQSGPLIL